jgi:DNA-binding CsgD family transcriptional regulator
VDQDKEQIAQLSARQAQLSERQAACIFYTFEKGLKIADVAMLLGIEERTVEQHLNAACRVLGVTHFETAARIHRAQQTRTEDEVSVEVPVAVSEVRADALDTLSPPSPPIVAEALVGVFCKREMREAVLGDLDEKFAELAERRGAGSAKAWYWGQAGRSVLFFAVRWGRRLLELEAILKRIL